MSFGDPNNPYGQPPQAQPGPYGQPPQAPYGQPAAPQDGQPGYGYPQQAPPAQQPYGYPQQPQQPQQPYGYPQQAAPSPYGAQGGMPGPGMGMGAPQGYASWGARVGAFLLDYLIVGLIPTICGSLAFFTALGAAHEAIPDTSYCRDPQCVTDAFDRAAASSSTAGFTMGALLLILLGSLAGLIGGIFILVKEGSTGQTPGKKAMNIRLVSEATGQPIGFGMAFLRRLCHIVDALPCYLGFLWPAWDEKGQTFADKFVGTVVVRTQ
ncbi:RDD family protein [Streptomyces sp. MST-110588]|uniref:RDD family protein n=1 Tax=Streptomyces sp. MST-110588 TaxID=2833628 RepID=UPI001F5C563C|nr:RDD family protein [Streptomyces sp. MST-110588]UNO40321.1 RDD family protein [Streptomyces sp. MST-110588]